MVEQQPGGIRMITLVLGGNKSGKSDFALSLLEPLAGPKLLVVTGKARDMEFRRQITEHQQSRGPGLAVLETSRDLPQALIQAKLDFPAILVDSLDYWLFACCEAGVVEKKVKEFKEVLAGWGGADLILVSCEIGLGPLSADRETRRFARDLGALNQAAARLADSAYMVAAGLPLILKKG